MTLGPVLESWYGVRLLTRGQRYLHLRRSVSNFPDCCQSRGEVSAHFRRISPPNFGRALLSLS